MEESTHLRPNRPRPLAERFWEKVDRTTTPDGCWIWTGCRHRPGYGRIGLDGGRKVAQAHRVAYELQVGPIPPGLHVCHTCDNPPCVRGDHLFVGTNADNVADKVRKGRAFNWLVLNHPERVSRGTAHYNHKLTPEKVILLRRLLAQGLSQRVAGEIVGVAQTTVAAMVVGRTWRHVP